MDQSQQENFRILLTDAIIKLCRAEAVYSSELSIEGTVCVVSDRTSTIIAHFTECIGDTGSLSLESERDNSSETVFQQHDYPSIDHAKLLLPDVKVEQVLSDDEIITTFEAINDSDTLAVVQDFCDSAEKSLNGNNDNAVDDVNQLASEHYQCLQCDKVCNSERALQKHMKIHRNRQLCSCLYCRATFTSVTELQQHIKTQHSKWSKCQVSDKKVANKLRKRRGASQGVQLTTRLVNAADQDKRQNKHVPDDQEMTDGCLEAEGVDAMALLEALEQNDYEKMMANAQLLTNTTIVENRANAVQPLTELQKHVAPETCSNKSMDLHKGRNGTKSSIMQYFEKVHVEMSNGLYKYSCCLCHKMFKIRTSLYEHINSHTGLRRYACDQCDSRFVHHSTLHNHVRNKHMAASHHPGNLRYACTGCDRRFRFFSQFKRHLVSNPSHCTKLVDDK